jgi:hypothetical protein
MKVGILPLAMAAPYAYDEGTVNEAATRVNVQDPVRPPERSTILKLKRGCGPWQNRISRINAQ